MEISGKIIQVLPLLSGTAKSTGNPWKKQEYVLETHDNFPRKVKFDFFGERVEQYPLAIGDEVTVSFDLESREFNGRWYTDVRAWKAEKQGQNMPEPGSTGGFGVPTSAPQQVPAFGTAPAAGIQPQSPFPQGNPAEDDLPF